LINFLSRRWGLKRQLEVSGAGTLELTSELPSSNFDQFFVSTLGSAKKRLGASDLTRGFARAFVLIPASWNFDKFQTSNSLRLVLVGLGYGFLDNEMVQYVLPLPIMANYSKPEVITQVEKIRSEIQQFGESRVGCEELSLLCSDVSAMQEKIGIEQIAEYEGWSFQYLLDGHVRFAPSATALRTRPRT
jgi:hypothetical protein